MSAALAIFLRARIMLKLLTATRKHPFLPGLDNPQAVFMDLSSSQLVFNVPAGNECERRYKPLATPLIFITNVATNSLTKDSVRRVCFNATWIFSPHPLALKVLARLAYRSLSIRLTAYPTV